MTFFFEILNYLLNILEKECQIFVDRPEINAGLESWSFKLKTLWLNPDPQQKWQRANAQSITLIFQNFHKL